MVLQQFEEAEDTANFVAIDGKPVTWKEAGDEAPNYRAD